MSQALPTPGREPVTPRAREMFVRMLAEREAEGIATYGTSLQTENGRDVHRDLCEEIIDSWMYATQARMERERRDAALRRIAALVDALPVFVDENERTPEAQTMRALREAVAEWRSKA